MRRRRRKRRYNVRQLIEASLLPFATKGAYMPLRIALARVGRRVDLKGTLKFTRDMFGFEMVMCRERPVLRLRLFACRVLLDAISANMDVWSADRRVPPPSSIVRRGIGELIGSFAAVDRSFARYHRGLGFDRRRSLRRLPHREV